MAKPHLLRYLRSIVTLYYLSSITAILLSTFITSSAAMAEAFVSVTPAACHPTAPSPTQNTIQDASGTIKSVSGQTLQITPKTSGMPINATYSSTTRIMELTLITTPPASVLQKGIDVFVQVIQNPNGSFTATSITLRQANQPDHPDCFADGGQPTPSDTTTPKKPGQQDNHNCFADKDSGAATTSTQSNTPTTCMSGTVIQLQSNTLTITNRQQKSYTIALTSGTKIIKIAPATGSALKAGTNVTVIGPANKGVIAAFSIIIGIP
jgi:hypothetical protein